MIENFKPYTILFCAGAYMPDTDLYHPAVNDEIIVRSDRYSPLVLGLYYIREVDARTYKRIKFVKDNLDEHIRSYILKESISKQINMATKNSKVKKVKM